MKRLHLTLLASLFPLLCLSVSGEKAFGLSLKEGGIEGLSNATPFEVESLSLSNDELYVQPGGMLGHWGVGNGGDYLRIGFARAREHAANIVSRVSEVSLKNVQDESTRLWILKNQKLLAADILTSVHVWEMEAKPTCGWTVMPGASDPIPLANPIQLSYPTCRDKVFSFYEATQLLIHEAVHHFGEGEDLADKVAIAIVDAWREGRIEWLSMNVADAPTARSKHSAVWTGSEMVIFGGIDGTQKSLGDGYRYDPSQDSWAPISELQGLKGRHFHSAHWTGDEMIVWGGYQRNGQTELWQYDGFIWDPEQKSVTEFAIPSTWAPETSTWTFDPRQKTVWTGTELIIWGGVDSSGNSIGGKFNPDTMKWESMGRKNSLSPNKIAGHSLVWTGNKLIVWGGYEGLGGSSRTLTQSGAVYDMEKRNWTTISIEEAPSKRAGHEAFWTGDKMVVFSGGGVSSQRELKGTGAIYDLKNNSWVTLTTEMVIERIGHTATWNGHELLVYGGRSNRLRTYFGEVYNFDPTSGRWSGVNSRFTPVSRYYHSAVWTGSSLIVWGGSQGNGQELNDGGIYFP